MNQDHSVDFKFAPKYCVLDSLTDSEGYSISSKGSLPTVVNIMIIWLNLPIPVHFSSLILKMSMFTLAISCLTTSNLSWFVHLTFQVPIQYCSLQHWITSITSHIHNWVLFLLWLGLFILSGAISLLFSSSILGTYLPGGFIFQCHIFLPFHTVHGVLKARILQWFAILFFSGPHFVRPWPISDSPPDLSLLGCSILHGS